MRTILRETNDRVGINAMLYPDNQPHVNVPPALAEEGEVIRLVWRVQSALDLVQLAQVANVLTHRGVRKQELVIPYLMGARGDRAMIPGDSVDLIGSYTYQYNTRDTFGIAMKSTNVVINGVSMPIFKTPITDNGVKKSATGLLQVWREHPNGPLLLRENVTPAEEQTGELVTVFENGRLVKDWTLAEIRDRLSAARAQLT